MPEEHPSTSCLDTNTQPAGAAGTAGYADTTNSLADSAWWQDQGASSSAPRGDYFSRLQQATLNEKLTQELLPYQQVLVDDVRVKLDAQDAIIDDFEADVDKDLQRYCFVYERERAECLLKNYLRTRFHKIRRFAAYILDNTEMQERLSRPEAVAVQQLFVAESQLLKQMVMDQLPMSFRSLVKQSDATPEKDMIEVPQLDHHVFCKVVEPCGDVPVGDGETVDMAPGDQYIIRYRAIADLVKSGRVHLI